MLASEGCGQRGQMIQDEERELEIIFAAGKRQMRNFHDGDGGDAEVVAEVA